MKLLGVQATGVFSIMAWVIATSAILFFVIKKTAAPRVSKEEELKGLDIEEHGMESYHGFQIFKTR